MGKLDLKLLQGIEEAEGQIRNDKQESEKGEERSKIPDKTPEKESSEKSVKSRASRQTSPWNTPASKDKKDIAGKKSRKQVFSFRAQISDINRWKAYATSKGETMESIGGEAMNEYISRHRLSGTQLAVFEALRAREEEL